MSKLTNLDVDLLVAKLEGIEVEIFEAKDGQQYVTERLPFCPEGPANYYPPNFSYMLRFYQPTKDWSVAGPIIERERICISYSDASDEAVKPYAWAYYPGGDEDSEEVMFECEGETGPESAMRSFVCKHFGSTIDLQNLPKIERTAIVRINGFTVDISGDIPDFDDSSIFFDEEIEVVAETKAEATRKAVEMYLHLHDSDAHFLRWK